MVKAARNPYVGPRPFEAQEADLFFGREHEANQLLALITARPVVLLFSPSGAGKTSLLNTRILPGLLQEGFQILPAARVGGMLPADVEEAEIANIYTFSTLSYWDQEHGSAHKLAEMRLVDFLEGLEHPLNDLGEPVPRLAIWDQFEELFSTHLERWRDREDFFSQLADALEEDPLLSVVLSLREEYLGQLEVYAPLLPDRLRARVRLEPMKPPAAREALIQPLRSMDITFTLEAANRLIEDLLKIKVIHPDGKTVEVAGQYVEPLQLQVVARTLVDRLPADCKEIGMQEISSLGNPDQSLSNFYENIIREVTQQVSVPEENLREWFEHSLITPAGTRSIVFRDIDKTAGLPNKAVDILEYSHIIRAEFRSGARWYELTHDRFIQPILTSNQLWRENFKPRRKRKLFGN